MSASSKTQCKIPDISGLIILSFSLLLLLSCGNAHDADYLPSSRSASVKFYVTDNVSDYKQVIMGINKFALVNSGAQNVCTVLEAPVNLDIPKLADLLQLVAVGACSAASYNRVHLELKPEVQLMDKNGATAACRLGSYIDSGGRVNRLQCDPANDICTLDISGAARRGSLDILPDQENKVAVDFDLKDFSVTNFGQMDCSVTVKVTPLQASDIIRARRPETISGPIGDLDTEALTFRLKKGGAKFVFSYAAIAATRPNLGLLLQRAQDDVLKVWIKAADLGSDAATMMADDVLVMVPGSISGLDSGGKTFDLTYKGINTITVSYASAETVEGVLSNGARVETKLYGYADSVYLAKSMNIKTGDSECDN